VFKIHDGPLQQGLARSAALLFLPIAGLLAAKSALHPMPIRYASAAPKF
jgi:hypothetical protein